MKTTLTILGLLLFMHGRSQSCNISGQVISIKNSKAIPQATIWLNPAKKSAVTDAKGRFLFEKIPAGKYSLDIMVLGYLPKIVPVSIEKDSSLYLRIEYGDTCQYDARRNNNRCPICHRKNKVIPIMFGLPIGEMDTEHIYYAGCEVTMCDPTWYCKRDNYKF